MLLMLFCRFLNHFSALYWKKNSDNLCYPDVLQLSLLINLIALNTCWLRVEVLAKKKSRSREIHY